MIGEQYPTGSTLSRWMYWPALLVAALAATLAPWYFGVVDIDVRPALRILLTGGAIALALMQLDRSRGGAIALVAPHALGVLMLGAAWYALGTFNMAAFLILFAVPTYAAAFESSRWIVLVVAVLSVIVSVVAALAANADLRWHLTESDAIAAFTPAWLGMGPVHLGLGSLSDTRTKVTALTVFAVTMVAVASLGGSAANLLGRQARTLRRARRAHSETASLASTLLDDATAMRAIAHPVTGRIYSANSAFRERFGDVGTTSLIDVLQPIYPEPLARLLVSAEGGDLTAQTCGSNGEVCLLDIGVEGVEIDGQALKTVRITNTPGNDLAVLGLDALGIALLVLAPNRHVAFCNDGFRLCFPDASIGAPAARALAGYALPARWWDIAPSRSSSVRFQRGGEGHVAKIALSGTRPDCALTLVALQPEGMP